MFHTSFSGVEEMPIKPSYNPIDSWAVGWITTNFDLTLTTHQSKQYQLTWQNSVLVTSKVQNEQLLSVSLSLSPLLSPPLPSPTLSPRHFFAPKNKQNLQNALRFLFLMASHHSLSSTTFPIPFSTCSTTASSLSNDRNLKSNRYIHFAYQFNRLLRSEAEHGGRYDQQRQRTTQRSLC